MPVLQATDLFSKGWHDHDEGKELPCTSARTLATYLLSDSATGASVSGLNMSSNPAATFGVLGPKCSDGKFLRVSHRLNKDEFSHLPEEERARFVMRLVDLMAPEVPSWRVFAVLGVPKP